jgi:hypothetical protein
VLEHGGLNVDTGNLHTHQFDVHGTEDCCFAELYCAAVYLILDGKRYRIPDAATYSNLFRNRNGIEVFDLSAIPQGGTISTYAKLARSADDPAVYLAR